MNSKIINISELSKKLINRQKKIIALSHGVFDLIHHGHLRHFEEVKKNCDILVVSVTSDEHINKGDNRPYFKLNDRMYALSKIESIDFVVESNSKSSFKIISKLRPNLYCKGPDYKDPSKDRSKKIFLEKSTVEKNGGKLFITSSKTSSSSKLINSEFIFSKEQLEFLKKIKKKHDLEKIIKILKDMSNQEVFLFGESIIDIYSKLNVLNKSGKESVLNFAKDKSSIYLGGVLSIANHISNFIKKITIYSYLGENKKHLSVINRKLSKNIEFNFYKKKKSPTIEKKRYIDNYSNRKIIGIYNLNDDFIDKNIEKKIISKISKIPKNKLIMTFNYGHGFITKKIIEAQTLNIDNPNKEVNVKDKIVVIENADPGYDWILSQKIVGLITKYGGVNSHMSIRCEELNMAASIGVGEKFFDEICKSSKIILNCKENKISIIN